MSAKLSPISRTNVPAIRQFGVIICIALLATVALTACAPDAPPHDTDLRAITAAPPQPTVTPVPTPTPARALVTATPDLSECSADEIAAIQHAMPDYRAGSSAFAKITGDDLTVNSKPFTVHGINYYPTSAPWQRFPTADLNTIEMDFASLSALGINTVRVFLWYPALFTCPGSGAVPDPAAFAWFDAVLRLANAHDLRVIVVLHHLPDLRSQPIYANPPYIQAQTAFIVTRYREEPAIIAWDVRDAGDADYASLGDQPALFERAQVLDWLARTAAAIRELDPNHLITAGWQTDVAATIPLVDVVSFQHFGEVDRLREKIADLRTYTAKPLLLIAFGMSTFAHTETEQADLIDETLRAAATDHLAGWLVWTMYDFPVAVTCWPDPCASFDDARHHFGLWRVDGSAKLAVTTLSRFTHHH